MYKINDKEKKEKEVDEMAAVMCDCENCSNKAVCAGCETFFNSQRLYARPLVDAGYGNLEECQKQVAVDLIGILINSKKLIVDDYTKGYTKGIIAVIKLLHEKFGIEEIDD